MRVGGEEHIEFSVVIDKPLVICSKYILPGLQMH